MESDTKKIPYVETKKSMKNGKKKRVSIVHSVFGRNCNLMIQSIFNWFTNHARTEHKLNILGMKQRVTFETVFLEQKKKEINELHKSLSKGMDVKQGIGLYAVAKKEIRVGLTEEEIEEYEQIVLEQKGEQVPLETQTQ